MPNPECPECGSDRTYPIDWGLPRRWGCKQCGAVFDPKASPYCTDPTMRIQREEEAARRRREKLR